VKPLLLLIWRGALQKVGFACIHPSQAVFSPHVCKKSILVVVDLLVCASWELAALSMIRPVLGQVVLLERRKIIVELIGVTAMFARFRSPGLFVVHLTHMTLEAIVVSERRRASFESADKSPSCLLLSEDVVGLDRRRRAANQMLVSVLSSNEVGNATVNEIRAFEPESGWLCPATPGDRASGLFESIPGPDSIDLSEVVNKVLRFKKQLRSRCSLLAEEVARSCHFRVVDSNIAQHRVDNGRGLVRRSSIDVVD
jgi:hypothetical protein